MLGRRNPQRSFFGAGAQLGRDVVERMGFYGRVASELTLLFRDEDFASCYCEDNGRPSAPPSLLAAARLLQHYDGVSDAEVIARCRFDLRWKVALDLQLDSIDAPFAKSTYQAFRYRLTLHEREGAAFERSVRAAKEKKLLPKNLTVALDSSPVRGRGAVKDTFNLLSDAIAGVIRAVAAEQAEEPVKVAAGVGLGRHLGDVSVKGSEVVDWDSAEQVGEFLRRLLADCERAVDLAEKAQCGTAEVELLKKIIDQDVERTPDAGARIKRGVAKGRTVSVSDPDMRHGHKSSGKAYSGHKAHVAVEVGSGVITAVDVGAPGEADGARVKNLIDQTEAVTDSEVAEAIGDSAYSSREAIRQADEAGVSLSTKMPSPAGGCFGPGDFTVGNDGTNATCPAGHRSMKVIHSKVGLLHHWSTERCGGCPLRGQCTRAARRTLLVPPDFHDRRRREREARSPAGRIQLRRRIAVEHAIARIKNLGAGAARYFGRTRTKAQWLWSAAVVNLMLVWRLVPEATP